MEIGVDATCWQNKRGYGRHARALLSSLVRLDTSNRYTFFLDSPDLHEALPPRCDKRLLCPAMPTSLAASASGRRSIRDMWRTSQAMSGRVFDLLFFPTIYSYVPTFSRAKKLVMIHDTIAETYPHLTVPRPLSRLLWNAKVALGRFQADALVTVSEYSRQGILRRFGIAPERVFVVGEASDPIFRVLDQPQLTPRLLSLGISDDHRLITYVGGFSPHKNLHALIAAFAELVARKEYSDLLLVMVGEYQKEVFHSYFGTIKTEVERFGLGDRVIFTGYLPDDQLVVLLNLSTVLALPSLMEGFGLPALEAAACGCPVIATNASPLPELLGDGGIYIEPRQEELQRALETVLNSVSLRSRMRMAGLSAASRLSWDAAARQMISVMFKLMMQ